MALINCPECGKEVSDKAESCPGCGFGVREQISQDTKKDYTISMNKANNVDEMVSVWSEFYIERAKRTDKDDKYYEQMFSNLQDIVTNKTNGADYIKFHAKIRAFEYNFLGFTKEMIEQNEYLNQDKQKASDIRYALLTKNDGTFCPNCGSDNIQAVQKKWSIFTGFMTNKVDRVCLQCENKF